ncbi:hexosaminidase [bacterium A37T11]|nr:hexosaminidase [bacterium A37T11]
MNCLKLLLLLFFNALVILVAAQKIDDIRILPQPFRIILNPGVVTLSHSVNVYVDPKTGADANYIWIVLQDIGFRPAFVKFEKQADIIFKRSTDTIPGGTEAYQLTIDQNVSKGRIIGIANGGSGIIYALQTLRQLSNLEENYIKFQACVIYDKPFFAWRAFMLDESRHFQGKEVVKKLIDEMARIKLNTFHWHLVDDQGWRIEIKKYPLLTKVSSKSDYSHLSKGISPKQWDSLYHHRPGFFYTQNEIREIVAYANARGVRIIPEIEIPGHASASIYAYPWLGASSKKAGQPVSGDLYLVTDPRVKKFLKDVLDEIIALFPAKIIHIGGDEANYAHWQQSEEINAFMKSENIPTYSDLQVWTNNKMSRYISSKGCRMIGWNEITGDNIRGETHIQASQKEKLAPGTIVQFWDGAVNLINKAIDRGYDVVNSNRFFTYLDYSYETTSFEKAYSFNPIPEGIAAKDQNKILGLGAQMWGELTPTEQRLYYQIFPRLAAYAEVGWVNPAKKSSYPEFLKRFMRIESIWRKKGYIVNSSQ